MFTGIVQTVGEVAALERRGGDVRLYVRAPGIDWRAVMLGDSIATNGVCLTAVNLPGDGFWADVSVETLTHTTIGDWQQGTAVNLELALTPGSRLGGHFVSGHVDGIGEVIARAGDARSERFEITLPAALARFVAQKGSITIDGTSLTVNSVEARHFAVNIVPHTLAKTVIGGYRPGTRVNLEVDILARYLERLLAVQGSTDEPSSAGISTDFLAQHGFFK